MLENEKVPVSDFELGKKIVEEGRLAQVKPLNRKKNDLIDELKDLNTFLERTSARLFKFVGIYEKGFLAMILPNLILLLVATVEMPMNMTAFESLEMGQNETILIAILFGLTIATMAHFTGYFFKRYVVTKQPSHVIIAIFIFAMTTVGLYVSAELRGRYLATMHEDVIVPQFVWFFMSVFIFSAGVVSSYKFASSAKNEKEEKNYFQKLREFNRKKRQLSRLNNIIISVNKKSANEVKRLVEKK